MNKTAILLPSNVAKILEKLENAGFQAYIVGGCVRDSLLGEQPHDWDICTNALPEQIKEVFTNIKTVDTGIQHGTVTLVFGNEQYEVTTYRIDGDYSDGRHPDSVVFSDSLKQDLSRRDFTVNAMAYNPRTGIVDYFNGQYALMRHRLLCVGNPDERFQEDALRMIRAIRLSITKGFHMTSSVCKSIKRNAKLIQSVSKERIHDELIKTFSPDVSLDSYDEEIILLMYLLELSLYGEADFSCIENIDGALLTEYYMYLYQPSDMFVKLAFLIELLSGDNQKIMKELKFTNEEQKHILRTIKAGINIYKMVIRFDPGNKENFNLHKKEMLLSIANENGLEDTLRGIEYATMMTCSLDNERFKICNPLWEELLEYVQETPYQISQLAVTGNDLIKLGIPEGEQIGTMLNDILRLIMSDKLKNNKEDIMRYVRMKLDHMMEVEHIFDSGHCCYDCWHFMNLGKGYCDEIADVLDGIDPFTHSCPSYKELDFYG